jgi:hypothetical protein
MTWRSLIEGLIDIAAFALPAAILVWADWSPDARTGPEPPRLCAVPTNPPGE